MELDHRSGVVTTRQLFFRSGQRRWAFGWEEGRGMRGKELKSISYSTGSFPPGQKKLCHLLMLIDA